MIDHGYSLQNLIDELSVYQQEVRTMSVSELFEDWVQEAGFGSEIWACEGEWLACESEIEQTN